LRCQEVKLAYAKRSCSVQGLCGWGQQGGLWRQPSAVHDRPPVARLTKVARGSGDGTLSDARAIGTPERAAAAPVGAGAPPVLERAGGGPREDLRISRCALHTLMRRKGLARTVGSSPGVREVPLRRGPCRADSTVMCSAWGARGTASSFRELGFARRLTVRGHTALGLRAGGRGAARWSLRGRCNHLFVLEISRWRTMSMVGR
jgi:hypothetical protein